MKRYYEDVYKIDEKLIKLFEDFCENRSLEEFPCMMTCLNLEDLSLLSSIIIKNEWIEKETPKILTYVKKL